MEPSEKTEHGPLSQTPPSLRRQKYFLNEVRGEIDQEFTNPFRRLKGKPRFSTLLARIIHE
jgi:hypothetical protein